MIEKKKNEPDTLEEILQTQLLQLKKIYKYNCNIAD